MIEEEQIQKIMNSTSNGKKYLPEFSVDIKNESDEVIARVHARRHPRPRTGHVAAALRNKAVSATCQQEIGTLFEGAMTYW
ncbi:hypothetical protein ACFLZG_07905 [Thermodesulfobacteriota bacterium]